MSKFFQAWWQLYQAKVFQRSLLSRARTIVYHILISVRVCVFTFPGLFKTKYGRWWNRQYPWVPWVLTTEFTFEGQAANCGVRTAGTTTNWWWWITLLDHGTTTNWWWLITSLDHLRELRKSTCRSSWYLYWKAEQVLITTQYVSSWQIEGVIEVS